MSSLSLRHSNRPKVFANQVKAYVQTIRTERRICCKGNMETYTASLSLFEEIQAPWNPRRGPRRAKRVPRKARSKEMTVLPIRRRSSCARAYKSCLRAPKSIHQPGPIHQTGPIHHRHLQFCSTSFGRLAFACASRRTSCRGSKPFSQPTDYRLI